MRPASRFGAKPPDGAAVYCRRSRRLHSWSSPASRRRTSHIAFSGEGRTTGPRRFPRRMANRRAGIPQQRRAWRPPPFYRAGDLRRPTCSTPDRWLSNVDFAWFAPYPERGPDERTPYFGPCERQTCPVSRAFSRSKADARIRTAGPSSLRGLESSGLKLGLTRLG